MGLVKFALCVTGLAGAFFVTGCSTSIKDARRAHDGGAFVRAFEASIEVLPNGEPQDRLWLLMEHGKFAQDAGAFAESDRVLESAWQLFESRRNEAYLDASVALNDVNAFVVDERQRRYTGSPPEQVLVQTSQVINALMLGDPSTAQVQVRRLQAMRDRIPALRQAGERARREFNSEVAAYNRRKANEDARARAASREGQPLTLADIEGLREFGLERRYLAGVVDERGTRGGWSGSGGPVRTARGDDGQLPYSFYVGAIGAAYGGEPNLADQQLDGLGDVSDIEPPSLREGRVYVLFEGGRSPRRFPVAEFYAMDITPLPVMRTMDRGRPRGLRVATLDGVRDATRIGSVEAAVCDDFSSRLWSIWGRPILSSAVKIGVGAYLIYEANQTEEKETEDYIQELIGAVIVAWGASAQPDLRNWQSLPAEHWVCEVPMPADGVIELELLGNRGVTAREAVRLPAGGSGIVYVRSVDDRVMIAHGAGLDDSWLPLLGGRDARDGSEGG